MSFSLDKRREKVSESNSGNDLSSAFMQFLHNILRNYFITILCFQQFYSRLLVFFASFRALRKVIFRWFLKFKRIARQFCFANESYTSIIPCVWLLKTPQKLGAIVNLKVLFLWCQWCNFKYFTVCRDQNNFFPMQLATSMLCFVFLTWVHLRRWESSRRTDARQSKTSWKALAWSFVSFFEND